MATTRAEDDRAYRRDWMGLSGGAVVGGTAGLLLGALLGQTTLAALAGAIGIALGAWAGKAVAARVSVDDWDPGASDRPYVGAHAPDDDSADAGVDQRDDRTNQVVARPGRGRASGKRLGD
jgi:hypothetical protein